MSDDETKRAPHYTADRWATGPSGRDDGSDWCPPGVRLDPQLAHPQDPPPSCSLLEPDAGAWTHPEPAEPRGGRHWYIVGVACLVAALLITGTVFAPGSWPFLVLGLVVTGGACGLVGTVRDHRSREDGEL